jgi:AraC-like DNA-binding protein
MPLTELQIQMSSAIKAQNGGLFISRGNAMHPTRTIDSHELIFVKQGELDMWEEDQIFHLTAGQCLHLYPGRQHGSTKMMPPDLKFYWLHFELANTAEDTLHPDSYAPLMRIPQVKQVSRPEKLELLFRMFMEDQETEILEPIAANLLTSLILNEVSLAQDGNTIKSTDISVIASSAHAYIRMNFDVSITASKIAKMIGYNVDYLGRVYKQIYGYTLTHAIHKRRIEVACQLLLDTNLPVQHIASKCGFSDSDYFRRIFRRQMQMTPGDYRNAYTHVHINTH